MYDLLLTGGMVIDPSTGLSGAHDIAIERGKIARVDAHIAREEARRVLEVPGTIVTPGLIDLHVHVFEGFTRFGVHPDQGGVYAGVTTLVDAGSAGCATFGGFPHYILPQCHSEIIPFLHICQTGLSTIPDIIAEGSIDLDGTLRVVDIGDTEKRYDPTVIRRLLPMLERGDILTHYFTANPGGVLDGNGRLVPEAWEAEKTGVWFDTAHGQANFSFDIGRRIIDQGLLPHCISTDLTVPGRLRTVHSMTEMMTRFLGLGFTLEQVVTMCTANPAKAIGAEDRLGTLAVGRQADISVLKIIEGDWTVYDVLRASMRVKQAAVPVLTVKRGEVFSREWGPRPWGWEPDPGPSGAAGFKSCC